MKNRRRSSPKAHRQKLRPESAQPQPLSSGRARRRSLLAGLAVALTICLAAAGYLLWPRSTSTSFFNEKDFPLPPLSASPFLNTQPDARYVGSAACRSCHEGEVASFRRTGMGRSMAAIDPAAEPPDATIDHKLSQRRYQVQRKDGKLWHREFLLDDQPDQAILAEHALQYVIGSGNHARTYATEVDGFLVESPLTWYASTKSWRLSPGYERSDQMGFGRGIEANCLFCHAGQVEPIEGSAQRFQIHEAALSCERCHGPGSIHIARHSAKGAAQKQADGPDYTIVNPSHLSRTLAEAICQQCHLNGAATIDARGRKPNDFRPGLPRQDFRHDYTLDNLDGSMTVTGHVEQMHRSRCYQRSETLTCTSCHNPHGEPQAQERVEYYRAACLECHAAEKCKVDAQRRQRESPDNDCVHCHMPRTATDVPHVAFTEHRIGVHTSPLSAPGESGRGEGASRNKTAPHPQPLSPKGRGESDAQPLSSKGPGEIGRGVLQPFFDLAGLSEIERQRSLGLALAEWSVTQDNAAEVQAARARAAELLSTVRAEGLRDPIVDVMLVRLGSDVALIRPYIGGAFPSELTPMDRCAAFSMYAEALANEGRCAEAVPLLRQVVRMRRISNDWQLLAYCERNLGNIQPSVEALEMAITIDTRLIDGRKLLVPYYRQRGDHRRADWHQRRISPSQK